MLSAVTIKRGWLGVSRPLLPEPDAEGLGLCASRVQPAKKPLPVQQEESPTPTVRSKKKLAPTGAAATSSIAAGCGTDPVDTS